MPKLWSDTIEAHRNEVREAILDATWRLVSASGPAAVTMSEVAESAGVGRATLYKYFPDVQSILSAWHQRQIQAHLQQLSSVRSKPASASQRLGMVLAAYANICREQAAHQHAPELVTLLHGGGQVEEAQKQLHQLITELVREAAHEGSARGDVAAGELATFCLHALTAAARMTSAAGVARLVDTVLRGLK